MRAVRVHPTKGLVLEDLTVPEPGAGQALVAVAFGGICGSDLHYASHGRNGAYVIKESLTLGHEFSGRVVRTGPSVPGTIRQGDPVTAHPAWPSPAPGRQDSGLHTLPEGSYLGSASTVPHTQGGFCEFLVVRHEQLRKLPDTVPLRTASVAEPLAVALHAVSLIGDLRGKRVLVNGCGPIGLLSVLVVAQYEPAELMASDLSARALGVARELGAGTTMQVPHQSVPRRVADVVVEASGAVPAIESSFAALAIGGTLLQLAIPAGQELSRPIADVLTRELVIQGSWRFDGELDDAVEFLARHPEAETVISHEFQAEDAVEAFRVASDVHASSKVLLSFGGLDGT